MPWEIIFASLIVLSFGMIVILMVRAMPRLDAKPVQRSVMERWLTSEFPERLDSFLHSLYLRTLRRLRILILKADNTLMRQLEKMKLSREEAGAGTRVDLKTMTEKTLPEIGEETETE